MQSAIIILAGKKFNKSETVKWIAGGTNESKKDYIGKYLNLKDC